jgi:hypothetical protein
MRANNSPSFQQLLNTFENPASVEIKKNSNINDTASETQQENLRLAKEYINTIVSKPNIVSESKAKKNPSFEDQALALGLKVTVIKNITR